MKTYLISFLSFLLTVFVATPIVLAKDNKVENKNSFKLQTNIVTENELVKININNNKFEIMGTIEELGQNSFKVSNITIQIDPTKVPHFEQKGILEIGKKVKVEGLIINNINYATEFMVIGTGQGRYKFEYQNGSNIEEENSELTPSPSPTSEATATPIVSPTPEATIAPSTSPTTTPIVSPEATTEATESDDLLDETEIEPRRIELKVSGMYEDVKTFFEQMLSYFKNL